MTCNPAFTERNIQKANAYLLLFSSGAKIFGHVSHSTELVRMCLACQHFDFNSADWISDNLHVISSWYLRTMGNEFIFSSADVRGAGTHDEPLRTSAWEARSTWTTSVDHPWILKMNFTRGLTNFKNLKCKSLCNRPFPSSKKSHFQSEAKCEAIDMKMIFNYDANKTHFHDKGFALSLVLKVRFFGTWKRPWFLSGLWAPHITHCLVQSFPEFHTNLKDLG